MAFMLENRLAVPANANGRASELIRAIHVVDGNTALILETNANNFLNGIRTTFANVIVFEMFAVPTAGAGSRLFISYGYFLPQP